MNDLLIRLIDKNTTIYINYLDICAFSISEDSGWFWINLRKESSIYDEDEQFIAQRIEKFSSIEAAQTALDNICLAIALNFKYITLLPDGEISESIDDLIKRAI